MPTSAQNKVLDALLERLYAALARGPALNAHPGNSRQRLDLVTLERLGGQASTVLSDMLGPEKCHKLRFTATAPPKVQKEEETEEQKKERRIYEDGQKLLRKLATVAKEADTYQRDTGSAALYIGYPLLSLPEVAARSNFGSTRLLAPLAFIPITLEVATGSRPGVTISSAASGGADRVIANVALKTWIERQAGSKYPELFEDEEGSDPLREISELMQHVAEFLGITVIPDLANWPVERVPESKAIGDEACFLPGAVLGLFPISKQGAIRDLEEIKTLEVIPDTVRPFVTLDASLTSAKEVVYTEGDGTKVALLPAADEHLVDWADPCQRRAVIRSRATKGLVVHGPPGTGKSQTITNIIGDYLARKKKVLLVCEKRTALDVVKYRLDARGLAGLCAVVHDATSDRTGLYTGVRDQLDALADAASLPDPTHDLGRVNSEIDNITKELREYYEDLRKKNPETGRDFHDLVGLWLSTGYDSILTDLEADPELKAVSPELLRPNEGVLRSAYRRLIESNLADNGWDGVVGLTLEKFFTIRQEELRRSMDAAVAAAKQCQDLATPTLPPFGGSIDLAAHVAWRQRIGDELLRIDADVSVDIRGAVAGLSPDALRDAFDSYASLEPVRTAMAAGTPAADLQQAFNAAPMTPPQVAAAIPALGNYLQKVQGIFGFFQFAAKKAAAAILAPFGLPLDRTNVEKVRIFLEAVHVRNILRGWLAERMPQGWIADRLDAVFTRQLSGFSACVTLLMQAEKEAEGVGFASLIRSWFQAGGSDFPATVRQSADYARSIIAALDSLHKTGLFIPSVIESLRGKLLHSKSIYDDIAKLREDLDRLEPLLRFHAEVAPFPPAVGNALRRYARNDMEEDAAWGRMLSIAFDGVLDKRIQEASILMRCDATRIDGNFKRLRELTAQKLTLESARICHLWQQHQRERLLAMTGTRLNSNGADLRRRLMLRGKLASRIRQVIHEGRTLEGGDPLFDIHPVWMTSPETASLIFPTEKVFDVVIFDEASQCRLEEGLPVLLRGENIVIAGDTKQLPPTRFFESAIVSSDAGSEEDMGQEGLFQAQQSDIEDLLSASLNTDVEQSYLDVHYRSSNEDLIRFSNESFYGSRLQAVPGHPNARAKVAPIQLNQIDGVYKDRQNPQEADFVVERVRALLNEEKCPSIGIVSFNLTQKDLIEEKLDKAADADPAFRLLLDQARTRERNGAFEGLFVKNLENVQGDERDVIIISTTYGRTEDGKFHRRFGPLGRAGGERRLNVIVTRARQRVEIVTSIPSAVFRADANASVPAGSKPNGAWFLMRYLRDAEVLGALYEKAILERPEELPEDSTEQLETLVNECNVRSTLVETIARLLQEKHGIASVLYHGNEGFYVDLAFRHPKRPDEVSIGVIVDSTRYTRAQDSVEWDGFKRVVLEAQKWELHRIWSPQFRRDPEGVVSRLVAAAEKYVQEDAWHKEDE